MSDQPPKPPIITEPHRYLVVPMPRPGQATVRLDGHHLRIRSCPTCTLYSTIPVCPLCGTETVTSTPDEASLGRDQPSLRRPQRPARGLAQGPVTDGE